MEKNFFLKKENDTKIKRKRRRKCVSRRAYEEGNKKELKNLDSVPLASNGNVTLVKRKRANRARPVKCLRQASGEKPTMNTTREKENSSQYSSIFFSPSPLFFLPRYRLRPVVCNYDSRSVKEGEAGIYSYEKFSSST